MVAGKKRDSSSRSLSWSLLGLFGMTEHEVFPRMSPQVKLSNKASLSDYRRPPKFTMVHYLLDCEAGIGCGLIVCGGVPRETLEFVRTDCAKRYFNDRIRGGRCGSFLHRPCQFAEWEVNRSAGWTNPPCRWG